MSKIDHAPFERVKQRPPDDRWFRQEEKERKEKKKKKTRACAIAYLLDAKREMRAEKKVKKQADMRIASHRSNDSDKHLTINDPRP
jgi:CRISPR/Cas system CSM-associated protein Csm4 (group 5 of RAMP superfamily)